MITVKPYKEILAMTKEKLDEMLIPVRARQAKSKADLEIAKLEEQVLGLESAINESCAKKDLDFTAIITKCDELDLLLRKKSQLQKLVADLFPETV